MSAFSAIQSNQEILYVQNSSDEEELCASGIAVAEVSEDSSAAVTPASATPVVSKSAVFSNFQASVGENMILKENSVVFVLKNTESLVFKGQCLIVINQGDLVLDGILYKSGDSIPLFAPTSHSLPLTVSSESSDYTEIEVFNNNSNIQSIGYLCPVFKNIFHNNLHDQFFSDTNMLNDAPFDLDFSKWTFCPVLRPAYDLTTMSLLPNWKSIETILQGDTIPKKVLVIGYKNSGKSTLLRYLINSYLSRKDVTPDSVGVLDVDPGQSEYSIHNCVSYTSVSNPVAGSKLYPSVIDSVSHNEYFGFSSPSDNPHWFLALIKKIYEEKYVLEDAYTQVPLIVNMPGWVKGYGIQLIYQIVKLIKPTDIVYLKNQSESEERKEEVEDELLSMILEDSDPRIKSVKITRLNGYTQSYNDNKLSSQDLSVFRILSYFHHMPHIKEPQFDFTPLLLTSPLKVNYSTDKSLQKCRGIAAVTIYNDEEIALNRIDKSVLATILDCSIAALYAMEKEATYGIVEDHQDSALPLLIPFNKFEKEFNRDETVEFSPKFLGLAMIHSINYQDTTLNLYMPDTSLVKNLTSSHSIVLARGKTSIPAWEMDPKADLGKKAEKLFKGRSIPFVSSNDQFGKGGKVLKVRRNILRRR